MSNAFKCNVTSSDINTVFSHIQRVLLISSLRTEGVNGFSQKHITLGHLVIVHGCPRWRFKTCKVGSTHCRLSWVEEIYCRTLLSCVSQGLSLNRASLLFPHVIQLGWLLVEGSLNYSTNLDSLTHATLWLAREAILERRNILGFNPRRTSREGTGGQPKDYSLIDWNWA